jgi:hypothetical protein
MVFLGGKPTYMHNKMASRSDYLSIFVDSALRETVDIVLVITELKFVMLRVQ